MEDDILSMTEKSVSSSQQHKVNANHFFFDILGIVYKEFVPTGQTVNGNFFCEVFRWLRENMRRKRLRCGRTETGCCNMTMHQHTPILSFGIFTVRFWDDWGKMWGENTWDVEEWRLVVAPWQCASTQPRSLWGNSWQKIRWPLFPTLPIHLTWPPCNFYMFPTMKLRLKRRCIASIEEIQAESQQVLNMLTPADFNEWFQKWRNRWYHCIQDQGDYFEGDGGN